MTDTHKADTTAIPIDTREEVHDAGGGSGTSSPISQEQDKDLREGRLPADRFDDDRMKEAPSQHDPAARDRTERGNRGPDQEPGFGQGA